VNPVAEGERSALAIAPEGSKGLATTTAAPHPWASVIIPAFNEAQGIRPTLEALLATQELQDVEIVVVDDGSTDDTAAVVAQLPRVKLVRHPENQGYGAAIGSGLAVASGRIVAWFDADGQHRPEDLVKVLTTLRDQELDYCVGVRGADSHHVGSRKLGKLILRKTVEFVVERPVGDFNSGLRAFRTELLRAYAYMLPRGFGASTTTTLIMLQGRYRGLEVPIVVKARIGKSSVRQIRDGFRTLNLTLRILLYFRPMKFFGGVGLTTMLASVAYGTFKLVEQPGSGVSVLAAVMFGFGAQTLFFGLICDQISLLRRGR
jgi:glycosyltransferase involved in cell wall biosynthesis